MKVIPFDPGQSLIYVGARLFGPAGHLDLELAFDTGASVTLVTPKALAKVGYRETDRAAKTRITSALGSEPGYLVRVREFRCLGYSFNDFLVHAHSLAESDQLDGLLGLDFLRHFDYEVRSRKGLIRVQPA